MRSSLAAVMVLAGLVLSCQTAAQPADQTGERPVAGTTTGYPVLDEELSGQERAAFAALVAPLDPQARARLGRVLELMPLYHRGALALTILAMPDDEAGPAIGMLAQPSGHEPYSIARQIGSPAGQIRWRLLGQLARKSGPSAGQAILAGTAPETACAASGGTAATPDAGATCVQAGRFFTTFAGLPLVVGGYEAPRAAAPWQVQIFAAGQDARALSSPRRIAKDIANFGERQPDWQHHHICGGVWLGDRWVLTAAHCVRDLDIDVPDQEAYFFDGRRVRTGSQDISEGGQIWRIESLVRHGAFTSTRLGHDIALLRLAPNPVGRARTRVAPAQLPQRPPPPGTALRLTGWGLSGETISTRLPRDASGNLQAFSQYLLTGPLVLRPADACNRNRNYLDRYRNPPWQMMAGQICAGTPPKADTEIDACQGDSGGPLVARRGAVTELVGLVSFGPGCGLPGTPGIYTNVAHYVPWIRGAMAQARPGMIIDWVPGSCHRKGKAIACAGARSSSG